MTNKLQGNYTLNSRDEIVKDLWIGQQPLDPHDGVGDFKFVICLTGMPYYNVKLYQTVVVAPFDDSPRLPPKHFLENLAKMVADFSMRGPTLVHCLAGINRSALVTGLALVNRGYAPEEAIELIRAARGDVVLSNKQFEHYIRSRDMS